MTGSDASPTVPAAAASAERSVLDWISSTADGVFAVDRQQRVGFWSESARRWLGPESCDVIGRECWRVLAAERPGGGVHCATRCETSCAASRGRWPASIEVVVRQQGHDALRLGLTTIVPPPSCRSRWMLIHLFRPIPGRDVAGVGPAPCVAAASTRLPGAESKPVGAQWPTGRLTPRELQVLMLLSDGSSTTAIAGLFDIGQNTVRSHVQSILSKLDVRSRLHAVAVGRRAGLV